jgi:hypothetical protein
MRGTLNTGLLKLSTGRPDKLYRDLLAGTIQACSMVVNWLLYFEVTPTWFSAPNAEKQTEEESS